MWQYENPSNELYHYGVKGMHWGVRRYQNSDGSLTRRGHKKVQKTIKKINRRLGLYDSVENFKNKNAGPVSTTTLSKAVAKNVYLGGPIVGAIVTHRQYKNAQQYVARKIQYLADKGVTLSKITSEFDAGKYGKERFTTYT